MLGRFGAGGRESVGHSLQRSCRNWGKSWSGSRPLENADWHRIALMVAMLIRKNRQIEAPAPLRLIEISENVKFIQVALGDSIDATIRPVVAAQTWQRKQETNVPIGRSKSHCINNTKTQKNAHEFDIAATCISVLPWLSFYLQMLPEGQMILLPDYENKGMRSHSHSLCINQLEILEEWWNMSFLMACCSHCAILCHTAISIHYIYIHV